MMSRNTKMATPKGRVTMARGSLLYWIMARRRAVSMVLPTSSPSSIGGMG